MEQKSLVKLCIEKGISFVKLGEFHKIRCCVGCVPNTISWYSTYVHPWLEATSDWSATARSLAFRSYATAATSQQLRSCDWHETGSLPIFCVVLSTLSWIRLNECSIDITAKSPHYRVGSLSCPSRRKQNTTSVAQFLCPDVLPPRRSNQAPPLAPKNIFFVFPICVNTSDAAYL